MKKTGPTARVTCLGAAHWDVIARAGRPPATGDDLPGSITRRPGGVALNVALALARRGIAVEIAGAVGSDEEGDALLAHIRSAGIGTDRLLGVGLPTDSYVAVEDPEGALVVAVADCRALEEAAGALVAAMEMDPPTLLVVDGNLRWESVQRLAALPCKLFAVPASKAKARHLAPLLAAPRAEFCLNRREAEALLGRTLAGSAEAARALIEAGARLACVTDGPLPASLACGGHVVTRAPEAGTGGVTGAGDAFAAALIAAGLAGEAPIDALDLALNAARSHMSDRS